MNLSSSYAADPLVSSYMLNLRRYSETAQIVNTAERDYGKTKSVDYLLGVSYEATGSKIQKALANAQNALSQLQTADESYAQIQQYLGRLGDIAQQMSQTSVGDQPDRDRYQLEAQDLLKKIQHIGRNASSNTGYLLRGEAAAAPALSFGLSPQFSRLTDNTAFEETYTFTLVTDNDSADAWSVSGSTSGTNTVMTAGSEYTSGPGSDYVSGGGLKLNLNQAEAYQYGDSFTVSVTVGGDGTLTSEAFASTGGAAPADIKTALLDGDTDADAAVLNSNSNSISILSNDGTGGFSVSQTLSTGGTNPKFLAAGDIDSDGDTDLVSTNYGSASIAVFTNNSGTFSEAQTYGAQMSSPFGITMGDVDADNDQDVVITNISGGAAVFKNDGTGAFSLYSTFSTADGSPRMPLLKDFDGNGTQDLAILNGSTQSLSLYSNTEHGAFSLQQKIEFADTNVYTADTGDINGDGYPDIVAAGNTSVSVALNTGNGTFTVAQSIALTTTGTASPKLGDMDGDGDLDIGVLSTGPSSISVLKNDGTGTFSISQSYDLGSTSPQYLAISDVNGDGGLDFIESNFSTNNVGTLQTNTTKTAEEGSLEEGSTQRFTAQEYSVLTGPDNGQNMDISVKPATVYSLGIHQINLLSADDAATAYNKINAALQSIKVARTKMGGQVQRLEHQIEGLSTYNENISAAAADHTEADMDQAIGDFAKSLIANIANRTALKNLHSITVDSLGTLIDQIISTL